MKNQSVNDKEAHPQLRKLITIKFSEIREEFNAQARAPSNKPNSIEIG